MRVFWLWATLLVLMSACAAKRSATEEVGYYRDSAPSYAEMDDDAAGAPMAMAKGRSSGSSSRARAPRRPNAAPPPSPLAEPKPVAPEEPAAKRMVFYEATTTLRVARLDQAVDAITKTTVDLGGIVTAVDRQRITVRVPVASFRDALKALQAHGDVVAERISAQDVTEAFQDVSLRLDTAKATRDRLIVLLAKAQDEQEKLQLVRQIQRLTEQIDRMESQSKTLASLASMSRIILTLQPREALANRGPKDESEAFRWIRRISPFGADTVRNGRTLRLDVPEGMVALSPRGPFVAEGPDGARIWSGRLRTDLQADETFWINAVRDRLGDDFESAEVSTVGDFAVVRFVQRDAKPYTWVVALRVVGKDIQVVEAFFADPAQTARFTPAVESTLRAAGGAS